ncbi:MAG: hypothetical protein FK734_16130, partial [Asgard group archaeon]|nr:hypothetical protein [Asgard group archaeon]
FIIISGTSIVLISNINELKLDLKNKAIMVSCSPIPNHYSIEGSIRSGTLILDWWNNNIFNSCQNEISDKECYSKPLLFPFWLGINTPIYEDRISGAILGITPEHHPKDFLRATIDGLCFEIKRNYDCLINFTQKEVENIFHCGGGSKYPYWNNALANLFSRNILIPEFNELTSFGAAIIATKGLDFFHSIIDSMKKITTPYKTYKLDEKYCSLYNEIYEKIYKNFSKEVEKYSKIFFDIKEKYLNEN